MCDIADATDAYPFTTAIVGKTTTRSKEASAGRDTTSTSQPPTSVPTEGKLEYQEHNESFPSACLRQEVAFTEAALY